MHRSELAPLIDHTVLGPETTPGDVERAVAEAADHGMNACVPPCYVATAAEADPDVTLATVVGFPHGQHAGETKRREGVLAWKDGADELDVVVNVGRLKAGEDDASDALGAADRSNDEAARDAVTAELEELVAAVPIPVKVIVETALLTDEQIDRACEAAVAADAAMVKTSTGFGGGGATVADVERMSEYLPVKASGGIGSYEAAMAMVAAGAERIGASAGVAILDGAPE